MLRNADGGGGVNFSKKKCYEGVRFNVISVTRGWVGVQFPEKKRYVTLEWPLTPRTIMIYYRVLATHLTTELAAAPPAPPPLDHLAS